MTEELGKLTGRRVYVTFLPDGTVAVQPSDCTGSTYSRMQKGILLQGADIADTKALGRVVLRMRDRCKTG